MPANKKYLTSSPWVRASKIIGAIVGGMLLCASFHVFLAKYLNVEIVSSTGSFSFFIVWVGLMIVAFLFEKAWKMWLIYMGLTLIFSFATYVG